MGKQVPLALRNDPSKLVAPILAGCRGRPSLFEKLNERLIRPAGLTELTPHTPEKAP